MEREEVEAQVAVLVESMLQRMGYELVRAQLAGARQGLTLQIMAERQDGQTIQVDDCAAIAKALDPLLDEADLIPGAYSLEVSSPGIDRPLTREKDFAVWAGHEAKIELRHPIGGRKNYRGILAGLKDGMALVNIDGEDHELPLTAIAKAKLVLTDKLIKAAGTAR
ncbi:MAG: ribosome maturation factor RimP [Alphaproteobacteria bacterium]